MSKTHDYQNLCRQYREEKGEDALSTADVVDWAIARRYLDEPAPLNPRARLADEMAKALREEIRHDKGTGRPYRVNHAVTTTERGKQRTLWGNIDHQSRDFMQKSFMKRREQIVGDCVQLTFDCDHFNANHAEEEPIVVPLDFADDVAERKYAPDDADEAA